MTRASKPAQPELAVERVALADLTTDPDNARLHGERSLADIAGSLRRFGQTKPIVVDARGVVLAGNGTLEAARALGWTHLDVVRTKLSGSEARAYAIADNRVALSSDWDEEKLVDQLNALGPEGLDGTGFTAEDLRELAASSAPPGQFEDAEAAAARSGFDHGCPKCNYQWSGPCQQKTEHVPEEKH